MLDEALVWLIIWPFFFLMFIGLKILFGILDSVKFCIGPIWLCYNGIIYLTISVLCFQRSCLNLYWLVQMIIASSIVSFQFDMLKASLGHKLEVGLAWLANWPSITVKRFISQAYLDLFSNNILKILQPVEVDLVFLCMVGKLAHFHCTFIFFFRPALTLDSDSVTYPNILTVSQSEFSSFLM